MKRILNTALILWFTVACSQSEQQTELTSVEPESAELERISYSVNTYAINDLVCDPFNSSNVIGSLNSGLRAKLFYANDSQSSLGNVSSYLTEGTESNRNFFFSDINVPTRLFSEGFPLETGGLVNTDQGDTLYEYFALQYTGLLQLRDDQEEGYYQLAILSDDGSTLEFQNENGWEVVVDNDGNHPTRMGCGDTVYMEAGQKIPLRLSYYQGPKHHISVIPIWRKVESPDSSSDATCGQQGNNKFFDFNNNSEPQQAYLDLLARDWEPIAAENYSLNPDDQFNPCYDGETPIISNLTYELDLSGGITVQWQTDIPATSQLFYKNTVSGEENVTESDNLLRTDHAISLDGLAGQTVEIQAISISATFGKGMSDIITVNVE